MKFYERKFGINREYYMTARGYEFYLDISQVSAVEREKIKFVSTSRHVIFCLLYKHTNYDVFEIFRRFPTTFRRFLKLFGRLN